MRAKKTQMESSWEEAQKGPMTLMPPESKRKTGSAMSDKQIARAAVEGRKLVFRTEVLVPMEGYIVGTDDYHWLVACPSQENQGVQTTLVHKSCPLVTFTEEFLTGELDEDREHIQRIGMSFWNYCISSGLSRPVTTDQERPL